MITLRSEPEIINPVFNDVFLVLESDNSTESDFRLVNTIEVFNEDTLAWENAGILKSFPNPNNGLMFLNVQKLLESYVSSDVIPELTNPTPSINQFKQYRIHSEEQYKKTWEITDAFDFGGTATTVRTDSDTSDLNPGDKIQINTNGQFPSWGGTWEVLTVIAPNDVRIDRPWDGTIATGATFTLEGNPFIIGDFFNTDDLFVHNSVLSRRDWLNWDNILSSNFLNPNLANRGFVTTMPNNFVITTENRAHFTVFDLDDDLTNLKLETNKGEFELDSTLIPTGTTNQEKFKILPTGYKNLEAIPNGNWTVISGTLPVFDGDTTQYTVTPVFEDGITYIGEPITFKIEKDCSLYERYELLFIDKAGALNSFSFKYGYEESITADRIHYNKYLLYFNDSNNTFNFNDDKAGKIQIDNIVVKRLSINSRWMKDSDNEYFQELFTSPVTILYDKEEDIFHRVNITSNTHTERYILKDKLFGYNLTVEFAIKEPQMR